MKKERTVKGFWVWGQFDNHSMTELTRIKGKVNKILDGPQFEPHLTLSGPLDLINKNVRKSLTKIANEKPQVRIYSEGIKTDSLFYQSMFIKIKEDKELLSLKKIIDSNLGLFSKEFSPHISLFYGKEKKERKKKIIKEIDGPTNLVLSSICLVDVNEEIDSWNVIESYQLKK